jgi:hypothetical protein
VFNHRGIVKLWYIYSVEYYTINKKDVLCIVIWDDLQEKWLSEKSKFHHGVLSVYYLYRRKK